MFAYLILTLNFGKQPEHIINIEQGNNSTNNFFFCFSFIQNTNNHLKSWYEKNRKKSTKYKAGFYREKQKTHLFIPQHVENVN